ncbi:unnamed protein product [Nezara viridula]|uniref:Odorant binding protein 2 n=1 Tax=Nezara viridula TaxID=85310 RepID=A0A4Y5RE58_NEZVI|nr:odorant binding protein 2 [Nezara viridula]CAH1391407.1 unnamed protein product [Nezara viridula]
MNRPVIVVALVLACIFSCNGISPELKTAIEECKAEHNVESDQIKEAIENKKLPETENGQCFMSCVMEKMGVIKDGKIDMDKAMEHYEKKVKDPENRQKANEVAKRCANVQGTDAKCSLATELVKCVVKTAEELQLEMSKDEVE